jgi:hypothetical protein
VRGVTCLVGGSSASNPPSRQSLSQRSTVPRVILTGFPNGSVCTRAAIARTIAPR